MNSDLLKEPWTVECANCGRKYDNWAGSTPCCGSIAYIVDESITDPTQRAIALMAISVDKK